MWIVSADTQLDVDSRDHGLSRGDVAYLVVASRSGYFLSAVGYAEDAEAGNDDGDVELLWDWSVPVADPIPLDSELIPKVKLSQGFAKQRISEALGDQLNAAWESDDWVRDSRALDVDPRNAWLLVGDQASLDILNATPDDFYSPDVEHYWTAPKQVQPGDLLFFYFMAPHKEVRFVGRAASFPFFANNIPVAGDRAGMNQWWVYYARVQQIKPIPLDAVRESFDGHIILRGGPTYVPPRAVESLLPLIDPKVLEATGATVPTGLDLLPPRTGTDLPAWTQIASGALTLERHVEDHIVEPLLQLAFAAHNHVEWARQLRIPSAGVVDYSVTRDGAVRSVIEVKLGVRFRRKAGSLESPDFAQVLRYANTLGVPSMLIDANRVFLFRRGEQLPSRVLERADFTDTDLGTVAAHLTG